MGLPYVTEGQLLKATRCVESKIPCFSNLRKVSDYLYEIEYDILDYDFAYNHFKKEKVELIPFGCSSIRAGSFFGRNFDWFYNNDCDFVIRTSCKGRIPSIGVAGSLPNLNKEAMLKGPSNEMLKLLPFYTLDGVNEAGVFINSNVVPQDKGKVIKTQCTENEEREMFLLMFPRFVLDNFTSAIDAIDYAKKHISFIQINEASKTGYDIHFMIGDGLHTYVVEIIDNKVEYKECDKMTNFHVIGTQFNSNGKVYVPATQDATHNAMDTNKVTEHGCGLERWNIMVDNMSSAETKAGMVDLMKNKLNYNNSYSSSIIPIWYTEFVGNYSIGNYTVKTSPSLYEQNIMPIVRERFANRNRDEENQTIWHTTHTSVYDLISKVLYIYDSTEDGKEHTFYLDNRLIVPGKGLNSIQTRDTMCQATGDNTIAIGMNTHAGATSSVAEGYMTSTRNDSDANAAYSHVEGLNNATNNVAEHGEGKFGISYYADNHDPSKCSIHYVGIGTNNQIEYRKDAIAIMENGDVYIVGIGGYDGKTIEGAQTVQQVLASLINN